MNTIESSTEIAEIVSSVTETMFGVSFVAVAPVAEQPSADWRCAALPIAGAMPLMVAVSADEDSCRHLSASLFSSQPSEVDESMIKDALCELVNITAGLVKRRMRLDQALGLPKIRDVHTFFACDRANTPDGEWRQHTLRAGALNLMLSIATRIV